MGAALHHKPSPPSCSRTPDWQCSANGLLTGLRRGGSLASSAFPGRSLGASLVLLFGCLVLVGCAPADHDPPPQPKSPAPARSEPPAPLGLRGAFHWQFPHDQRGIDDVTMVRAAIAAVDDNVFVPLAGGPGRNGVACLDAAAPPKNPPAARWVYKTPNPVVISPAATRELLLLVDGERGESSRHLHAVRIADQQRQWQVAVADHASGWFCVVQNRVVIEDQPGLLHAMDFQGKTLWRVQVGPLSHPLAADGETTPGRVANGSRICLVVNRPHAGSASTTKSLLVHDAKTGNRESERAVFGTRFTPIFLDEHVFIGEEKGPRILNASGGASPLPVDSVASEFGSSEHLLAFADANGTVNVLDVRMVRVVARFPGAAPGYPPLIQGDELVFIGDDGIYRGAISVPDAPAELWADLSWLGKPATPAVAYRGCLYMGVPRWGLVRFGSTSLTPQPESPSE